MKSDIQLYPDLIKALEKNEIVYLFGAGFSTALSGRKYTWWDWIVDGIGRIKDHATADMLNESLMSDNSTDNMVSVVGKVIKILKEEGSYKTWIYNAVKVVTVAVAITGVINWIFYRDKEKKLLSKIIKR